MSVQWTHYTRVVTGWLKLTTECGWEWHWCHTTILCRLCRRNADPQFNTQPALKEIVGHHGLNKCTHSQMAWQHVILLFLNTCIWNRCSEPAFLDNCFCNLPHVHFTPVIWIDCSRKQKRGEWKSTGFNFQFSLSSISPHVASNLFLDTSTLTQIF